MLRRAVSLAVWGVAAVGLAGCSGGTSPKTSGVTSTISRSGSTARATSSTLAGLVTATTATTVLSSTPPAAGTDASSALSDPTGPVSASTTRGVTATAAAARVVTRPDDNVHLGDTGAGVKQVQAALVAQGYTITTDGRFGAQTEQAVKGFQAKAGLKQDGVVGPATWAKLHTTATTATTRPATSTTKPKATTTTTTTKR